MRIAVTITLTLAFACGGEDDPTDPVEQVPGDDDDARSCASLASLPLTLPSGPMGPPGTSRVETLFGTCGDDWELTAFVEGAFDAVYAEAWDLTSGSRRGGPLALSDAGGAYALTATPGDLGLTCDERAFGGTVVYPESGGVVGTPKGGGSSAFGAWSYYGVSSSGGVQTFEAEPNSGDTVWLWLVYPHADAIFGPFALEDDGSGVHAVALDMVDLGLYPAGYVAAYLACDGDTPTATMFH